MNINDIYTSGGKILDKATYDVEPFNIEGSTDIVNALLQFDHYGRSLSYMFDNHIERIHDRVDLFFKSRKYTILGLWESTLQEYSPVENYDRYEDTGVSTDNHNSFDEEPFTVTETENPYKVTENEVPFKVETGYRPPNNNITIGAQHNNVVDKVSPDDNNNMYNKGGQDVDTGSRTDTTTYTSDGKQNVSTSQRTKDVSTDRRVKDTATDQRKRSELLNEVKNIAGHIHGNIGITSAMALLQEERLVRLFDFYAEIAKMIVDMLCLRVW